MYRGRHIQGCCCQRQENGPFWTSRPQQRAGYSHIQRTCDTDSQEKAIYPPAAYADTRPKNVKKSLKNCRVGSGAKPQGVRER
ncbi:hypothetical protein ACOMHN_033507 [Nucella lapillus]